MALRAAILGCLGKALTASESAFFRDVEPWGFILFLRNIETPDQVRRLVGDLRESVGRDAPVLIDQEGGRVARLLPPSWTGWSDPLPFVAGLPPGAPRIRAMELRYRVIGAELRALGIDVNCAPMLDIAGPGTHPKIRDRCYGDTPDEVARHGRAVADGLAAAGVLPVLKHIPGHGRAVEDSHEGLPVVRAPRDALARTDFAPFRALRDLPLAMTAHVVFEAIDADAPATLSAPVIGTIRREIGFDGLLMTDDLSMGALDGPLENRAEAALAAGCDVVLHCNGDPLEMSAIAGVIPELAGKTLARADAALARRCAPEDIDIPAALAEIAALEKEMGHA